MQIYDYYREGKLVIRVKARSQEHADLLNKWAFCGSQLSYENWCKIYPDTYARMTWQEVHQEYLVRYGKI